MKKILIIITISLLMSGCYDNIELNNLAIISGIGIDYNNDEYIVTYEILNDVKVENDAVMKSYTVSGVGKNINDAFIDTNYKVGKKPYFAHLKVAILSNSIINGYLDKITDYLIRDTNIRDEFMLMVANNTTPLEILQHNNNHTPVVSDLIMNLINNEQYNNNFATTETFQKTLSKLIGNNSDIVLNSISIIDNNISLSNFYIFKGYNYQNTLSTLDSTLYKLISGNVFSLSFNKNYPKGNVSISITNSISDIEVLDDNINIKLNLQGKVLENNADFILDEASSYQTLNNDFAKVIQNDVYNFIKILQSNKSDILGLQDYYFKKYKKDNNNLWQKAKVNVQVDLKINTKGFVFEVTHEK